MIRSAKDPFSVAFGRQLAALRRRAGLSQEDLSFRSGLHRTYVGAVERGDRNPCIRNVARLAKGLELEAAALLQGITAEPSLTAAEH